MQNDSKNHAYMYLYIYIYIKIYKYIYVKHLYKYTTQNREYEAVGGRYYVIISYSKLCIHKWQNNFYLVYVNILKIKQILQATISANQCLQHSIALLSVEFPWITDHMPGISLLNGYIVIPWKLCIKIDTMVLLWVLNFFWNPKEFIFILQ